MAIARAEAAWLEGRAEDAAAETYFSGPSAEGNWYEAGLNYWRWQAGADHYAPDASMATRLAKQIVGARAAPASAALTEAVELIDRTLRKG